MLICKWIIPLNISCMCSNRGILNLKRILLKVPTHAYSGKAQRTWTCVCRNCTNYHQCPSIIHRVQNIPNSFTSFTYFIFRLFWSWIQLPISKILYRTVQFVKTSQCWICRCHYNRYADREGEGENLVFCLSW